MAISNCGSVGRGRRFVHVRPSVTVRPTVTARTTPAPAVCPECLGTGMGGTGGICRCKCGTNSASVTQEKNL